MSVLCTVETFHVGLCLFHMCSSIMSRDESLDNHDNHLHMPSSVANKKRACCFIFASNHFLGIGIDSEENLSCTSHLFSTVLVEDGNIMFNPSMLW